MNLSSNEIRINSTELKAILTLGSLFSLRLLGLFMVLPVFAVYAQELQGKSPTLIGIALGIYGFIQAIFQIPFGFLSDRFGRKPMILIGLLLFCLGSILAALSDSMVGMIVGRSLQGAGAIGGVILALLTDVTREEVRVRAMTGIGISIALSFGMAFLMGPVLAAKWGVPSIFWLTAIFSLIGIALVLWVIEEPRVSNYSIRASSLSFKEKGLRKPSVSQLERRRVYLGYLGIFLLHASLTALFLKIPLMLLALEFPFDKTWHFYLPVFSIAFLLTLPIVKLLDKSKNIFMNLLSLVFLLLLSECLLYNFHTTMFGLALSLILFFIAFNSLEASLPAYISKLVPINKKGVSLGVFSTLQFLGLFFGGVIGGLLDDFGGEVAVLRFCVILAIVWLVCIFGSSLVRGVKLWRVD